MRLGDRLATWAVLAVLVGAGCVTTTGPTRRDRLLKRAAFDLDCTKDELTVVNIDARTRGVRGCGRKVTYVESCDAPPTAMIRNCTWVLNGQSKSGDDEEDE